MSTPQSHRHLPRSCPCFCILALKCKNVKPGCVHAPGVPSRVWDEAWPGASGWHGQECVRGWGGVGPPGPGIRRAWPLLWDLTHCTWARGVLSPERRQVGMARPAVSTLGLGRRQEGREPRHTVGTLRVACWGEHALLVRSSQHESRSGLSNPAENQPAERFYLAYPIGVSGADRATCRVTPPSPQA